MGRVPKKKTIAGMSVVKPPRRIHEESEDEDSKPPARPTASSPGGGAPPAASGVPPVASGAPPVASGAMVMAGGAPAGRGVAMAVANTVSPSRPASVPKPTVVRTSHSRISLRRFGVSAMHNVSHSFRSMAPREKRVFHLKLCQVQDVDEAVVLALVLPKNPHHSNWAEMIFNNSVQEQKLDWIKELNFKPDCIFKWINKEDYIVNNKGYHFRVFGAPITGTMTLDNFREYGETVARLLSEHERISEKNVILLPDDWILNDDPVPVWSDVIGYDAAAQMMMQSTGYPTTDTFYAENEVRIGCYFKDGKMPMNWARVFKAPQDKIIRPDMDDGSLDQAAAAAEDEMAAEEAENAGDDDLAF